MHVVYVNSSSVYVRVGGRRRSDRTVTVKVPVRYNITSYNVHKIAENCNNYYCVRMYNRYARIGSSLKNPLEISNSSI